MIFAIILLVLLLISLFGNFAQLVSQALNLKGGLGNGISREVGPNLDECLLKDNDASSKIAVVTVDGIISGQTVDQAGNNLIDVIQAQLDRAKDDHRVKAVILKVDSPGGEVLASDEIKTVDISDGLFENGIPAGNRSSVPWAAWPPRAVIIFLRPAAGLWPTT